MKQRKTLVALAAFIILNWSAALAQQPPNSVEGILLPVNPTSADSLKLSTMNFSCGGAYRYKANPYKVVMVDSNITVTLGDTDGSPHALCPVGAREEVDLGRLLPGNYRLTLIGAQNSYRPGTLIDKAPFIVADARANKAAPFVRLDYSGHWWDPNDSGWGLFIWQDAKSPTDNLLAAWFSYTADGKPIWYVFQPKWVTSSATDIANLLQGSRLPGAMSPPPTMGSFTSVGTAKLDFTNIGIADEGKLSYTFTNGATMTRNIVRFRP
jgi:hypothetical protein